MFEIRSSKLEMDATKTDGRADEVWSPGFSPQGLQLCKEIENTMHAEI